MSDNKPSAQPPIKDAVPDGKVEPGDTPQIKHLTFGQQLFIWTMVMIVGVIFGVGASFSLVFAPSQKIAGIAEGEVIQRMQVAERMERVLNPNGYYREYMPQPWEGNPLESMATDLRLARVAEARELMPKGKALDRIEQDFVAQPLPGSQGRSKLDALREHVGGAEEVQRSDLRRFLAERAARQSLFIRSAIAPAVPRAVAGDVAGVRSDRAEVAEVVLSGARFVPEVKPDDPEVAAAFEKLRATRFTRPGAVTVAVAWADRDEAGKPLAISDVDAEAWYNGHKDQFPGEPDAKDPSKTPEPKPFAQVKEQAIAKLRAERGTAAAQQAIDRLNQLGDELESGKDPARFRSAVGEAGLKLAELTIEDRTPGTVDLGAIGTVKDVMRLFGREHEPGFISQPLLTANGHWAVIRLESRREAGFQELDAVRSEVARYVAGRRAWKQLFEEAGKLRDELAAKGAGSLAAWAASDAAKPWNASLSTKPQQLVATLPVPAADPDAASTGDPQLVAALAVSARPVALVTAEPAWEGDVPRLRLVQVGEIKPASRDGISESRFAEDYRRNLARYSQAIFSRELQNQLDAK